MKFLKKVVAASHPWEKTGAPNKSVELEGTNLSFGGFSTDANGNTTAKFSFPNTPSFSIQTNGNLPKCHSMRSATLADLKEKDLKDIKDEAVAYLRKYGSADKKSKLKVYD